MDPSSPHSNRHYRYCKSWAAVWAFVVRVVVSSVDSLLDINNHTLVPRTDSMDCFKELLHTFFSWLVYRLLQVIGNCTLLPILLSFCKFSFSLVNIVVWILRICKVDSLLLPADQTTSCQSSSVDTQMLEVQPSYDTCRSVLPWDCAP